MTTKPNRLGVRDELIELAENEGQNVTAAEGNEARAAVADAFTALRKIANGEHSEGQTDGQIVGRMMETARVALARANVSLMGDEDERFCDGNCVWTDHHPACVLAGKPRVADDAVAELVKAAKAVEYWMQMHPNRASTAPFQPFRAALARFEVQL